LGRSLEKFSLSGGHLPSALFCPFVLIPDQVKNAMDHQQDDHPHVVETESIRLALGRLNGYHDISKEVGMQDRELSLSHGKSQDIRWFIPTEVSLI